MVVVRNENMATVWATSAHLTLFLIGFMGLSSTFAHWKNRATTVPRNGTKREGEHKWAGA
jgi:hypothetical protein